MSRIRKMRPFSCGVPATTVSWLGAELWRADVSRPPSLRRPPLDRRSSTAAPPWSLMALEAEPFDYSAAAWSTGPASNGVITTRSSEGFSSPPRADHTSDSARSSGGGKAMVTAIGSVVPASLPGQDVPRQAVVAQKAGQDGREQPVLVLGPLGPGRDQVRQLEVARRPVPRRYPAGGVVDVDEHRSPAGGGPHGCRRGKGRAWVSCGVPTSPGWGRRGRLRRPCRPARPDGSAPVATRQRRVSPLASGGRPGAPTVAGALMLAGAPTGGGALTGARLPGRALAAALTGAGTSSGGGSASTRRMASPSPRCSVIHSVLRTMRVEVRPYTLVAPARVPAAQTGPLVVNGA